jgi:hypothetical protein
MKFQVVTSTAKRLGPMVERPGLWVWELRPGVTVILDEDGCVDTEWVGDEDIIK